jgi:2-keto-3-deoxy-L-rhamnonate aldolase RhmA
MLGFLESVRSPDRCLFGTWAKLSSLETLEMLAYAGFDFVVIDTEHAPHTFETVYRSVVLAQALGMHALVRLPDQGGTDVQRILDCGVDGVLVPRVRSVEEARQVTDAMIFSPAGSRGLGITSRAGRWGLESKDAYVKRGNDQVARVLQLEDMSVLAKARDILDVEAVNAVFVGLGDLALSSGKPSTDPEIDQLVQGLLDASRERGVPCGTAVGNAVAAKKARDRGFSFVMVSNDATLFGRAASDLVGSLKD